MRLIIYSAVSLVLCVIVVVVSLFVLVMVIFTSHTADPGVTFFFISFACLFSLFALKDWSRLKKDWTNSRQSKQISE